MTIRISTALRNYMLAEGSIKQALQKGKLLIYSGSQPASADYAPTGTLLATITAEGVAHTDEVQATGTITISGTTGGVSTVTVNSVNIIPGGAVPFNTSLTQTAADLAAAINKGLSSPEYTATSSGAVVTITAARGVGTGANGFVVTGTYTGDMGGTYANMASGVDAVSGLQFETSASGTMSKDSTQNWKGDGVTSGVAGWARFVGAVADSGVADSSATEIRLDGSIGTSGTDIIMVGSASVASGAVQTIASFDLTMPAS